MLNFSSLIQHQLFVNDLYINAIEKPGAHPTIVFIHGRCLSLRMWEKQFASQLLSSYRLIAIDLPGHGDSDRSLKPMSDYSVHGLVSFLKGIIDRLELTDYVLVGHSYGAHFALEAILQLTGCRGIFAMTVPLTKPVQFDLMYKRGDLLANVYQQNPDSVVLEEYCRAYLRPDTDVIPKLLTDDFYRADPAIHEAINVAIVEGLYEDEIELVRRSNIPVAIVLAEGDQLVNNDYIQNFDVPMWLGNAQKVPNAGHFLPWENAEVVNQILVEFVLEVRSY